MNDPFDLLDLPARFDLDEADLHARFIRASAANHPDRHTDPVAQAEAAERSARINQAYAMLADPERRADALLTRLGGPARQDDKSLPPALLMEMMEVREQLEAATAGDDRLELERLRGWAESQRGAHLGKITELFKDAAAPLPADTASAVRLELNSLRYIQRMLDQMPPR